MTARMGPVREGMARPVTTRDQEAALIDKGREILKDEGEL